MPLFVSVADKSPGTKPSNSVRLSLCFLVNVVTLPSLFNQEANFRPKLKASVSVADSLNLELFKINSKTSSNTGIYQINCLKSKNVSLEEISRDLKTCICEHMRVLCLEKRSNILVLPRNDDFTTATLIKKEHSSLRT